MILALYDLNRAGLADHVGMVSGRVDAQRFTVWEGNIGNRVQHLTRDHRYVRGFAVIPVDSAGPLDQFAALDGVREQPDGSNYAAPVTPWYAELVGDQGFSRAPWCAMTCTYVIHHAQVGGEWFVFAYCPYIEFAARDGENGMQWARTLDEALALAAAPTVPQEDDDMNAAQDAKLNRVVEAVESIVMPALGRMEVRLAVAATKDDVDEEALGEVIARNIGTLSDEDIERVAKASADEQARRMAG